MKDEQLFNAAVCALSYHPYFEQTFTQLFYTSCPLNLSLNSSRLNEWQPASPSMLSYSRPWTPVSEQSRTMRSSAYVSYKMLRRAELEAEICRDRADQLYDDVRALQTKLYRELQYEHSQKLKIATLNREMARLSKNDRLALQYHNNDVIAVATARQKYSDLKQKVDSFKNAIIAISQAYDGFYVHIRAMQPGELIRQLFYKLNDLCDNRLLEAGKLSGICATRDKIIVRSSIDYLIMQQTHLKRRLEYLNLELQAQNLRRFDELRNRYIK